MTSLPATRFGLHSRGALAPGYFADIIIFDVATYAATSTYLDPHSYAVGLNTVMVNGRIVVRDGIVTAERPGRRLRRGTP
jgi:N-acyl-D-amino-acid deacylase